MAGREAHHQAKAIGKLRRTDALQGAQILVIHRQHQIEAGEVVGFELTRPQSAQIVAALSRSRDGARIERPARAAFLTCRMA